ncbi:MerR family transcriptional regulator [Microbispora cellulosiformans]|uniref:MerR family transcriptional regulator n=1 Tax=Microbispora cellulosiformans TaxID=2614688 RepID=A0A5J5K6S6_9ACTN|nr:chaperone modulator CbpM [Microbispora cellulosiformans]KAA9378965.1 MerR family transcriptional regulator [Microbispora cellulosiformans]
MTYPLVRLARLDIAHLDLESFSRATGLHPELVRRLVALGLIDAWRDSSGGLRFPPAQVAAAGRLQRLHAGLAVNYASLGLVTDLLDRIAELEAALRTHTRWTGDRSWT